MFGRGKVSDGIHEWKGRLLDGFQRNQRGGAMPVCQVCGALVTYETQQLHLDWHARRP